MAATNRRKSQRDWYHNRGRVRVNIPCEGSGKPPERVTDQGVYVFEGQYNKPTGDLPRGICVGCGDDISLVPKMNLQPEEFSVRKHKDPAAPYRHQMLVTEANYGRLAGMAAKQDLEPDDFLNQMLDDVLPKPSDKNKPKLV